MVVLNHKLKALKLKLKDWNKRIFGDVNLNVQHIMQKLDTVQADIDERGYSDELMD